MAHWPDVFWPLSEHRGRIECSFDTWFHIGVYYHTRDNGAFLRGWSNWTVRKGIIADSFDVNPRGAGVSSRTSGAKRGGGNFTPVNSRTNDRRGTSEAGIKKLSTWRFLWAPTISLERSRVRSRSGQRSKARVYGLYWPQRPRYQQQHAHTLHKWF